MSDLASLDQSNNQQYLFMFCQKLVIFNESLDSIFIARRKNEADFDGIYSFICGKLEAADNGIVRGAKREKDEEIGKRALVDVLFSESFNVHYTRKDGYQMILPHYPAIFRGGEIVLSDEYSRYDWVATKDLKDFEPKVSNIYEIALWAKKHLLDVDAAKLTRI